jgi:hypothetical protein
MMMKDADAWAAVFGRARPHAHGDLPGLVANSLLADYRRLEASHRHLMAIVVRLAEWAVRANHLE